MPRIITEIIFVGTPIILTLSVFIDVKYIFLREATKMHICWRNRKQIIY